MSDVRPVDDRSRPLDFARLFALGLNQVIGVGIFLLPARLASLLPGVAAPLCILLTALALAPVALTYAQLARVSGTNGGAATYARLAFGDRAEAVVLLVSAGGMVLGVGAIASGISEVLLPFRPVAARLLAAGTVLVLGGAASRTVTVSARVWTAFTLAKMLPLALLAVTCAIALLTRAPAAAETTAAAASSPRTLPAAALMVVYAFQGFELVPIVSGRSRQWARSVPAAMLLALLVAALLYTLLQVACLRLLGDDGATSSTPLVDLARVTSGPLLALVLGTGGLVSALGVAFGQLFVATELVAQRSRQGRDRRLLVVVGGALAWVVLVHRSVGILLTLAGGLSLLLYIATCLALVVLARRGHAGLRGRDAWIAVLALVVALGAAAVAGWWLA